MQEITSYSPLDDIGYSLCLLQILSIKW